MTNSQIRGIVPYVVGLGIAVALYVYAGTIAYTPRAGELGPAVWPRIAIGLMAACCLFEIVRRLAGATGDARGIADVLDKETEAAAEEPTFPLLLAGGIILVCVYAVLVPVLGFLLATFLF